MFNTKLTLNLNNKYCFKVLNDAMRNGLFPLSSAYLTMMEGQLTLLNTVLLSEFRL